MSSRRIVYRKVDSAGRCRLKPYEAHGDEARVAELLKDSSVWGLSVECDDGVMIRVK